MNYSDKTYKTFYLHETKTRTRNQTLESKRVTTMSRFDLGVYHLQNYGLWIVNICQRTRRNQFFSNFHCLHQTSNACLSTLTSRRRIALIRRCYYLVLTSVQLKNSSVYGHIQFTAICLKRMILLQSYTSNSKVLTLQRIGGRNLIQSVVYLTLVYN